MQWQTIDSPEKAREFLNSPARIETSGRGDRRKNTHYAEARLVDPVPFRELSRIKALADSAPPENTNG